MKNDYILFFNTFDKDGIKSVKPYMNYLHNHNMYFEDDFISEQIVKPDEFEVNFGDTPELLKKRDAFMLIYSDKNPTYTNLFGLDKDFIPTLDEIELIRSTWVETLEDSSVVLNPKFFKEEFTFNYRKPKESLKSHSSDEELRYCAIQKASIMLHDFYFKYDIDYRNLILNQKKNLSSVSQLIDDIYSRISENAVSDLQHVKSLTNSSNQEISNKITNLLNEHCITVVNWLKKVQELDELGKKEGIDVSLSLAELKAENALINENVNLEKMFHLMEKKYEKVVEERKIAQEKAEKEAEAKKKEKFESDLKLFNEIKETAPDMNLKLQIQHNYPNKELYLMYVDNETSQSFHVAQLDGNENFIKFYEDGLKEYNTFVELENQKKAVNTTVQEKKGITRIDEYGEGQIDWTSSKPNYVNDFKYEKNTPFPLRGRKQFCCWKTVWRPSGKKLTNERGLPVLDANGNPQLLPLYDKNGNIVYDDNGKVVYDGKWTKVPFNPNVPFNPEKPYLANAKSNDARTWGTFDQACKAVRMYGYDGLGIMLGNSVIGIDVDHVIGADGRFTEEALDIIETANSYTELSPSKTGLHILMFGELPEGGRSRFGNLEMYGTGRFFTLTGDVVEGIFKKMTTKQEGTKNVANIYGKYMPEETTKSQNGGNRIIGKVDWDKELDGERMLTNEEIINKLIAQGERNQTQKFYWDKNQKKYVKDPMAKVNLEYMMLKGTHEDMKAYYASPSDADFALCSKIWYYTNSKKQVDEIFRESGLMRDKWDEYRGFNTYAERTIENMVLKYKGGKYDPNYKPNYSKDKKQQNQNQKVKKGMELND